MKEVFVKLTDAENRKISKKMNKLKIFLAVVAFAGVSLSAKAQVIQSGDCGASGNNVSYVLEAVGNDTVLTISGSGAMMDYDAWSGRPTPWTANCAKIKTLRIGNSVTTIGNETCQGCRSLTTVSIPNSVTRIGSSAFDGCANLPSVNIPDSVTTIEDWVFRCCTTLTSVNIPNSVITIGDFAFNFCGITSATIGNSVTTIGRSAFSMCFDLTSLTIGNSVTSIRSEAFDFCPNLAHIYSKNATPPELGYSVFFYILNKSTCILHVPVGSKSSYAAADQWKDFIQSEGYYPYDNIVEDYPVTVINGSASEGYYPSSTVSIIADSAPAGQRFKKWEITPAVNFTEGTTANSTTAKFIMPADSVTATATYEPIYPVTVNEGTGGGYYAENEIVSITAKSDPAGQKFKEWEISSEVIFTNGTTAKSRTVKFSMPADSVTATAIYEPTYPLTVNYGRGTGNYVENDIVSIDANVPAGQKLKEWEISPEVTFVEGTDKYSTTAKLRMPAVAVTATATYEPRLYTVSVQHNGHGTASANPDTAVMGAEITLTTTANEGYVFDCWVILSGEVSISNDHTFTMPAANVTVRAYFKRNDVGIVETRHAASLPSMYPNPTTDRFIVDFEEVATIKLYDMLGKEVLTQTANGKTEINITRLPKGVYSVRVLSADRVIGNRKIVKQ